MTEMAEHDALLAERFAALATRDSGDWADVRRRVRRAQLKRGALAMSIGLVAVVVAAPALGIHREVVDWFQAEPATERTQLEFLQLGVLAPPGMDEVQVIPNTAREVTTLQLSTGPVTLVVAQSRSGGVCSMWLGYSGGPGCFTRRLPVRVGLDEGAFALGGGFSHSGLDWIPSVVQGHIREDDVERLVLEYKDGGSAEIPFVWVSSPIDAGFYIYEVPELNRVNARRATGLVGYDGEGKVVARQQLYRPASEDMLRHARLPDGEVILVPKNVRVDNAQMIIDVPTADGKTRMKAWLVHRTDGARCYVIYGGGAGCPPDPGQPPLNRLPGISSGNRVVLTGHLRDDVASVRLRYEDGTVELAELVQHVLIHEIPPSQYPQGRRLELMQALDADRVVLEQRRLRDTPGLYPCEKPVDHGHGVMACP